MTRPVFYYQQDGQSLGPVDRAGLRKLAKNGVIQRDTLIRKGENGRWVPAKIARGLFPPEDGCVEKLQHSSQQRTHRQKKEGLDLKAWTPLIISIVLAILINAFPVFMAVIDTSGAWGSVGWVFWFFTIPASGILISLGFLLSMVLLIRGGVVDRNANSPKPTGRVYKKSTALTIGLLSLLPIAIAILQIIFQAIAMFGVTDPGPFTWINALRTVTWYGVFGLLAFYLWFLCTSDNLLQKHKILWAVLLVFANVFAMPVFWSIYIWKPAIRTRSPED